MEDKGRLGRYQLLEKVATGGMAEVYRATTADSSGRTRVVAIKRILPHLCMDDEFIQLLAAEAELSLGLVHANIVRVFEFSSDAHAYFLAMEYVDGTDLRSLLQRLRQSREVLPEQHAAHIAMQVARGLHAAHVKTDRRGRPLAIVHRDVTPANVLLSWTGDVKLCDFGIAKSWDSLAQTETGVIKGKVQYMSPEQAMGLRVDCRSDLFSLGTLLYEMLTLTAPFCAVDDIVLLFAVRDVKMRPIGELRRDLDRELQALVGRAMAKSPEQRFQSGEELAEALSAFLKTHYPSYSTNDLRAYLQHMSSEQEEILTDDAYVEEIDEVEEVEPLDETEASGTSEVYSRSELRQRLYAALRTDSDLEAFCADYFPIVHQRFSNGMDRQAKLTLLLTMADAEVLVASLNSAEHARHAAATPAASRQPRDAGLRSQANETPSAEEAALERQRERRIKLGQLTEDLDAQLHDLRRRQSYGYGLQVDQEIADRYVLHEQLDGKGITEIWRAYDRSRGCSVALKALRGKHARDRSKVERFSFGARILEELRHPGIVRVLDAPREWEGIYYFILEYLPGGSLSQAVLKRQISRRSAFEAACRAGLALAATHQQGVVHRDLCPRKILLDRNQEIRITGFDLAAREGSAPGLDFLTPVSYSTFVCSEPSYVAPELMRRGIAVADRRSDVFALAMILTFVILGRDPTEEELVDRAALLRETRAPGGLSAVLSRALSSRPELRYPEIVTLDAALRSAVAADPEYAEWIAAAY